MKLIHVEDLFEVNYGVNLDLNKLEETTIDDKEGIRYVARSEKNNGVTAYVKKINEIEPNPPMTISVAGGGTVMSSFLQEEEYYSGRDLFYLKPKVPMTTQILLYYCVALHKNKFKFSYGRQANRTLKHLLIPDISEIPEEIKKYDVQNKGVQELERLIKQVSSYGLKMVNECADYIRLDDLFIIVNGLASSKVVVQPEKVNEKLIPYIRPSKWQSSSYAGYVDKDTVSSEKIFPPGTLYVSTDGAGSHTYSYVSVDYFIPNSNVCVLIPKKEMTIVQKLAYATFITANRFKFSYGRKPKGEKLKSIKLPKSIKDLHL